MKTNKQTIVIIILSLIILIGVGIYSYNQITDKAYQQGVEDSSLFIQKQIIDSLNQNGYVPFSFTKDDEIYQLKLGVIE